MADYDPYSDGFALAQQQQGVGAPDPNGISTMSGYQAPSPVASDPGAQPFNAMQGASTMSGYQPAYDPHPAAQAYDASNGDPNAPAAAQPNPNAMQPAPAPGAAPSNVPAPPHRMSTWELLGRIGDTLAGAGGRPQLYQEFRNSDQNYAAGQLDQQAKQQDIQQTGLQVADLRTARVGQLARGLKAIGAAGGNPATAAPILARQLGIPDEEAAMIAHSLGDPNNPGALDALVAATDPVAKTGAGGPKFGNQLVYTNGPDGKVHAYQPNSAGGLQEVHPGDGEDFADPLKTANVGDRTITQDMRTGKVVRSIDNQGKPDAGAYVTRDPVTNAPIYNPIPGSSLAIKRDAAAATLADKTDKRNDTRQKAVAMYQSTRDGLAQFDGTLDKLEKDPSLGAALGTTGAAAAKMSELTSGKIGGGPARVRSLVAQAAGETLKTTIAQLHSLSANGSLGFRATQQEFNVLTAAQSRLNNMGVTEKDYRSAIADVRSTVRQVLTRLDQNRPGQPAARPTLAAPARATSKPVIANW